MRFQLSSRTWTRSYFELNSDAEISVHTFPVNTDFVGTRWFLESSNMLAISTSYSESVEQTESWIVVDEDLNALSIIDAEIMCFDSNYPTMNPTAFPSTSEPSA